MTRVITIANSKGVSEYESDGKGAEEVQNLFNEIKGKL
jgi:hypothetical protein